MTVPFSSNSRISSDWHQYPNQISVFVTMFASLIFINLEQPEWSHNAFILRTWTTWYSFFYVFFFLPTAEMSWRTYWSTSHWKITLLVFCPIQTQLGLNIPITYPKLKHWLEKNQRLQRKNWRSESKTVIISIVTKPGMARTSQAWKGLALMFWRLWVNFSKSGKKLIMIYMYRDSGKSIGLFDYWMTRTPETFQNWVTRVEW